MTHRADRPRAVPWAAVSVFTFVSFGLAWILAIPLWIMDPSGPAYGVVFTVIAVLIMLTPALATLVVVVWMRQPNTERLRFLGMWPLRPARRVVWFTILATTVPLVLVVIITATAAVFGLFDVDLKTFAGFAATLEAQVPQGGEGLTDALPPLGFLVALQFLTVPFAALVNSVPAFGEELGWRGWLLPALMPLGTWPALVISGAIWGLWHSPLVLLGYNFGYTDWRGVALMTGGCIAWGMLLGWSRLRTGSVWPAVVGHGGLNAAGGVTLLVSANIESVDLAVVGPLGLVAWGVLAVVIVVMVLAGAFARQPELAGAPQRDEVSADPWRRRTAALAAPYARAEYAMTSHSKHQAPAEQIYAGYGTVLPPEVTLRALKREWGITKVTQAQHRIQHGITSVSYSVAALAMQRGESYESFYKRLSRVMPTSESMVLIANGYAVQQGQSGTADEAASPEALAYDIARYANLVRGCVATGLIDVNHAHGYSDVLGLAAALSFESWQDFGAAFVRGSAEQHHPERGTADAVYWLLHSADSPWVTEGWFTTEPS